VAVDVCPRAAGANSNGPNASCRSGDTLIDVLLGQARDRERRDLPIDRKPPSLPMLSTLLLLPMLRIDAKLPMLSSDAALATDSTLEALSTLQKLL
jgi:hypothetical protein